MTISTIQVSRQWHGIWPSLVIAVEVGLLLLSLLLRLDWIISAGSALAILAAPIRTQCLPKCHHNSLVIDGLVQNADHALQFSMRVARSSTVFCDSVTCLPRVMLLFRRQEGGMLLPLSVLSLFSLAAVVGLLDGSGDKESWRLLAGEVGLSAIFVELGDLSQVS